MSLGQNKAKPSSTPISQNQIHVLKLIIKEYEREWERVKTIDSKAHMLLGFGSIITSLPVGLYTLVFENISTGSSLFAFLQFSVFINVLLYVVATIFSLKAFWVRAYKASPDLTQMLAQVNNPNLTMGLMTSYKNYVDELIKKNNSKADYLEGSSVFFVFGVIATLVFTIMIMLLVR